MSIKKQVKYETYVRRVKAGPHVGEQVGQVLVRERGYQKSQYLTPRVMVQAPANGVVEPLSLIHI